MSLEEEITNKRQDIRSDAYAMSIGEIVSIYRDNELDIHPEFQREFRWKDHQKTKLIESILLGIPLPSFFVSQRPDSVWDLVDGVQRISTILEFMGELKNEKGELMDALTLEKTAHLPDLEGTSWNGQKSLASAVKIAFKREKIDFKIIQKESGENAKYEIFQRLNSGGSNLSPQELRNCLLLMLNRSAYEWLTKVKDDPNFIETLTITKKGLDEKYDMELALRFMIARRFNSAVKIEESDMNPYITEQMKTLLVQGKLDFTEEETHFRAVFKHLKDSLSEDAFKKFDHSKAKYSGGFSVSIFEVMSTGVSHYLDKDLPLSELNVKICSTSKELAKNTTFSTLTSHGSRSVSRFPKSIDLGRQLFGE